MATNSSTRRNDIKQRKPYKPTLAAVKRFLRQFLNQRRRPVSSTQPNPHWSEYSPLGWRRRIARQLAETAEDMRYRYRSAPRQAPDRLLEFPGDYQIPPGLSQREREILVMTAYGYSCQRIADSLGFTLNTIYTFKNRLGRKLDCVLDERYARLRIGLSYPRPRRSPPRPRQSMSDQEILPMDLEPSVIERDVAAVGVNFGSVWSRDRYRRSPQRKPGIARAESISKAKPVK
jgi:hypothetical protein